MRFLLLLCFSSFSMFAQNVDGKVLSIETNIPIENVSVYFKKEHKQTITNHKGEFNFKDIVRINPIDTLYFSIIGYVSKKVTYQELQASNYTVKLSEKIEPLDDVLIYSEKKLKKTISYSKRSSMPTGVYAFGSILIQDKLFVIGGNNSFLDDTMKSAIDEVSNTPEASFGDFLKKLKFNFSIEKFAGILQIYDLKQDTWIQSNLKLHKRAYHSASFIDGHVYILGGKLLASNNKKEILDDKIEVLDIKNNSIQVDDTNPHQAVNLKSFVFGNYIIVMGGSIKKDKNGKKSFTDKVHLFDTVTGYWYEMSPMLIAKEMNGVMVNNKIYSIGGDNNEALSTIETYDVITDQWNKIGDLFYGIKKACIAYADPVIYIYNLDKILTYNIYSNVLSEFEINLSLNDAQLKYYNNNLYLIGGSIEDEYSSTPSSSLYEINLEAFLKTKPIQQKKLNN